jgi:hypothetical protein
MIGMDKEGRLKNLPLYLIIIVLLYGAVAITPTSIELRDQRFPNFVWICISCIGLYTFLRLNILAGFIIVYACILSFFDIYKHPFFLYSFFSLTAFYLCITLMYGRIKDRKGAIYDALIAIALLNVINQILQYFRIYLVTTPIDYDLNMLTGLMSNANETSALYAMCFPAFLRSRRYWLLPVLFLGLYLCHTLNGVLAVAVVGVIYLAGRLNKKQMAALLPAVLIWGALYLVYVDRFDYRSHQRGRVDIWTLTTKIAMKKVTGWGFFQFDRVIPILTNFKYLPVDLRKAMYEEIKDKVAFDNLLVEISGNKIAYFFGEHQTTAVYGEAHNEYLEWFFISGWLGLIIAFFFTLRHLIVSFYHSDRIPFYGFMAASITAFFFFTWHIPPLALVSMLYIALIEGERNYEHIRLV